MRTWCWGECLDLWEEVAGENYVKVKVKLSLCFKWASRHEGVLGECRYSSTHSLIPALDGGEWSASHPGHFIPRERAPGTHWIGGWVGPRAVLDAVVKRKIPSPRRETNRRTPSIMSIIWLVAKYYYNDRVEEDEKGRACSTRHA
jgi:hypothetical protein